MVKLTGTDKIPEGAFLNLAAAGVTDKDGNGHTRLGRGEVVEAAEIQSPDRLQAAADEGKLLMEPMD